MENNPGYLKPEYFIWPLLYSLFSVQSLDVQQVDVYSSLEDNTNNPSHRKNPPRKVRARAVFLEISHMTCVPGERNPTQSYDVAGSKCASSSSKRRKQDVACTHQLGCTCSLSSLFQQNPGSCSSTQSSWVLVLMVLCRCFAVWCMLKGTEGFGITAPSEQDGHSWRVGQVLVLLLPFPDYLGSWDILWAEGICAPAADPERNFCLTSIKHLRAISW